METKHHEGEPYKQGKTEEQGRDAEAKEFGSRVRYEAFVKHRGTTVGFVHEAHVHPHYLALLVHYTHQVDYRNTLLVVRMCNICRTSTLAALARTSDPSNSRMIRDILVGQQEFRE